MLFIVQNSLNSKCFFANFAINHVNADQRWASSRCQTDEMEFRGQPSPTNRRSLRTVSPPRQLRSQTGDWEREKTSIGPENQFRVVLPAFLIRNPAKKPPRAGIFQLFLTRTNVANIATKC
jgi:hypothetical protein